MDEVICSLHEHVLTVQLNRMKKRNALTGDMYSALADTFISANSDAEVRAVVLTGGEACFSAGNDLEDFLSDPPGDLDAPVFRFMASVVEFEKPLVAAVCGAAIGIGTTVLAHCDLVFVTRQSKFAMPFVKLGLCPEFGSSLVLPAILGPVRARHLLLTGDVFSGQQAVDWGLATFMFETPQECHEATVEQARKLSHTPEGALLASKELLRGVSLDALREMIRKEGEVLIQRLKTEETRAALSLLVR